MNTFTAEQVEAVTPGMILQARFNDIWSNPREVVEITYRGTDVHGKAFVGYYSRMSENSTISGGVKEGEDEIRVMPAPVAMTAAQIAEAFQAGNAPAGGFWILEKGMYHQVVSGHVHSDRWNNPEPVCEFTYWLKHRGMLCVSPDTILTTLPALL